MSSVEKLRRVLPRDARYAKEKNGEGYTVKYEDLHQNSSNLPV